MEEVRAVFGGIGLQPKDMSFFDKFSMGQVTHKTNEINLYRYIL
jgi:hypothetical protein